MTPPDHRRKRPPATGVNPRATAARLLAQILPEDGQPIDRVLTRENADDVVRDLVYGVVRYHFNLRVVLETFLARPLPASEIALQSLLLVGTYQLVVQQKPDHAVVNESVKACQALKRTWAKGLVNGVLRNIARAIHAGQLAVDEFAERSVDLPDWLAQVLRSELGQEAEAVMRAFLRRPAMVLRVNTRRISPEDYRRRLEAAAMPAHALWADETLHLTKPTAQESLPGFFEGQVSVQDGGAQFAPDLLRAEPGHRVLDACAAPGGKLFHLMERYPAARFVAFERSPPRFAHLQSEAHRLGHAGAVDLHCADAVTPSPAEDPQLFDRILLDAPCSGTGTIRRHPDVKLHRNAADITRYAAAQLQLLRALWSRLQPGGQLLYCTCSLLSAENEGVITAFLAEQPDALADDIRLPVGIPRSPGWLVLPTEEIADGFYYARLERRLP